MSYFRYFEEADREARAQLYDFMRAAELTFERQSAQTEQINLRPTPGA